MDIKHIDLVSLFEQSLQGKPKKELDEIGIVVKVGDGICEVHGLVNAVLGERIEFDGGNQGIVFNLDENTVTVFLLNRSPLVQELEVAKRTGTVLQIPVGMALVGRTINALGKPIDGLGEIKTNEYRSYEAAAKSIIDRSPVNEPLQTGILAIDALVPVGKGQRELIIGNRNTGKTALVIDTILNQKGKNVFCIYVSIGQRQANIAQLINTLQEHGAMQYTIIVSADSSEAVLDQYLAPYVGCTIGEYFMDNGKDALVIYDDLSNHAIAFREMSLLMRRAPGREAYPGDVFYLHSRLLERAGKLTNGGSLTALPLVQIQSDDITAYIPTNLISITDGQIFLDTKLFNQGIRPAVNVELSVSRVGGAAQTAAVKKVTKALRLELAQYNELLDFAQFGSELDEISQRKLARGAIVVELLKQPIQSPYSFIDQTLILFALKENFLDALELVDVASFARGYAHYVKSVYPHLYETIEETKDLPQEIVPQLIDVAQEYKKLFVPSTKTFTV